MKKRAYRKTPIEIFDPNSIIRQVEPGRLVLAIDVAKEAMVASLMNIERTVLTTLAWSHTEQTPKLLEALAQLRAAGFVLEPVMESSACYGDVLRHQLEASGLVVFQVSGKRVHDSRIVEDGVASLHDAKSCAIIGRLHLDGRSSVWRTKTDEERSLGAAVWTMDMHQNHYLRLIHQLEGWLARYWPEVTTLVDLTSATLLALLSRVGGPRDVAKAVEKSRALMQGMSHRLMKDDKIEAVLKCAETSVGLAPVEEERQALMALAAEAHRALLEFKKARLKVHRMVETGPAAPLVPAVGPTTAAVLLTEVGDPRHFASASAYLKATGLNLKEKSSGKYQGRLRITKFGSGRARQCLWLAVFRWRKKDDIAQAWYESKVKRDGGGKTRAVVGLMRKMVKALYHVARGAEFDSSKLFDVARLQAAS